MKLPEDIFGPAPTEGNPQSGKILVAGPFLSEYYFNHAVIYLTEAGPSASAFGLVLNRRLARTLSEVIKDEDSEGIPDGIPLFCGGPVSTDHLFFLHRIPEFIRGAEPVGNGLYFGGDFADALDYIRDGMPTEGNIRFFVGYSGWSPGQLQEEIQSGSWAVADVPENYPVLSGEEAGYWNSILKTMGPEYSRWHLQPMNPIYN